LTAPPNAPTIQKKIALSYGRKGRCAGEWKRQGILQTFVRSAIPYRGGLTLEQEVLERLGIDELASVRLVRLAEIVSRSAARMLEKRFGVKQTELRILMRLSRSEQLAINELARQLDIDKGWISRSLRCLEERGLVERTAHPTDTRSALVRLTTAGRDLGRRMLPYSRAHNDRLFEGLNRAEAERMIDRLRVRAEMLLLDNEP